MIGSRYLLLTLWPKREPLNNYILTQRTESKYKKEDQNMPNEDFFMSTDQNEWGPERPTFKKVSTKKVNYRQRPVPERPVLNQV